MPHDIEMDLLLEGIYLHHGYDFRNYTRASLKRRLTQFMQAHHLTTVSALQALVLHEPEKMQQLILAISVHVTEMFRDPEFFLAFRQQIIAYLKSFAYFRIWHVGCATGEEVVSLAILLHEAGLLDRARIYATDMNDKVLDKAKSGTFPLQHMQQFSRNYQASGGQVDFSDYYTVDNGQAIFTPSLLKNTTFSNHNLATDAPFNEFQLIFCRNVMIYFNQTLKDRCLQLFYDSLSPLGLLALGSKESLLKNDYFDAADAGIRLYKKRPNLNQRQPS